MEFTYKIINETTDEEIIIDPTKRTYIRNDENCMINNIPCTVVLMEVAIFDSGRLTAYVI